jgi:hypothetical protein
VPLDETQRFLGAAFSQLTPLGERADLHDGIAGLVSGNDRLTPLEQAEIYREQFWLRHRDALLEDYPALAYLLGEEAFEQFVRAYLAECPPDSYTLRDLGNRIADFAAGYPDFHPERAGAARDLARYELAFVHVFDAPDVAPVPLERVKNLPPEAWASARLHFHPCLRTLALDHPVHELRASVKKGEEPARTLAPRETWLALWRGENLRVRYNTMLEHEHAMCERLRAGATLVEACDEIAGRIPPDDREAFTRRLSGWFRAWAERGWFIDVT